eukprot:365077-Chlamydomonas_euryale.AAC.16
MSGRQMCRSAAIIGEGGMKKRGEGRQLGMQVCSNQRERMHALGQDRPGPETVLRQCLCLHPGVYPRPSSCHTSATLFLARDSSYGCPARGCVLAKLAARFIIIDVASRPFLKGIIQRA